MRARLLAHLQALCGERHPFSSPDKLRETEAYLTAQFRALGLDVSRHAFEAYDGTYHNVVASLHPADPDAAPPLILAAHYDTVLESPGADDNASALAILLETARSLRGQRLAAEVRFLAFCLEEEDLLGSLAYTKQLKAARAVIQGAIVLECVGYTSAQPGSQLAPPGLPIAIPTTGDFLGIVGNVASAGLVSAVEGAMREHVPALPTVSLLVPGRGELLPDTRRSDHAAFWEHGYPALMLTDTANFRNPHYHGRSDMIETLDLAFMERVAEAVAAAAIRLAGPR